MSFKPRSNIARRRAAIQAANRRAMVTRMRRGLGRSQRGYAQSTVHKFKRSFYKEGVFASDPGSDQFLGQTYSLNQLPSYTDFTALFDQYRVDKIRVTFYPRQNVTNGTFPSPTNDTVQSCQVFSVIDYDDGTAPTALTDILQYQNLKTTRGLRVHSRTFKPGVEIAQTNNGTIAGSMVKKSPWLDCTVASVWHNGLKLVAQNTGGFAPITYDMKVDMWISCKNVR